jgi:hypothetical protein
MSLTQYASRSSNFLANAKPPVTPEVSYDWEVLAALTFTTLALSDIACALDAEEMVAATREAYGDSLPLKVASVAATLATGKMDALALEQHMKTVFTESEMKLPMIELMRASLLFLEREKVCLIDKAKFIGAQESIEQLARSTDVEVSTRAKQILEMPARS